MCSVRLHKKHGLNPTMGVCFWCGKEDGTIALLGAAYKGEAPKSMVVSMDPCTECKENMAKGVTLVETSGSPRFFEEKKVPIGYLKTEKDQYVQLAGRWWVITEEAAARLGVGADQKVALIEKGMAEDIGLV